MHITNSKFILIITVVSVILISGCTSSSVTQNAIQKDVSLKTTPKYGYNTITNYDPMPPKSERSDTTLVYSTPDCENYVEEQQIDAGDEVCEKGICSGEIINDITHCKEKCSMLVGNATRWGYSFMSGTFSNVCFCNICNIKKTQEFIQKELSERRKYWTSLSIDNSSSCSQCVDDICLDTSTPKRCIVGYGCRVWSDPSKCVKGTCHLIEYDGRLQAQCD